MAMVYITAMLITMATVFDTTIERMPMDEPEPRPDAASRSGHAADLVAGLFADAGWRVRRYDSANSPAGDMHVRRGAASFVVEVKAAAEGRSDRLIPLWSQVYLQALHAAGDKYTALAVIAAPRISKRAAEQVLKFASDFAPGASVGVVDFEGLRVFRGPRLDSLNAEHSPLSSKLPSAASEPSELFSDLNQWMLKVLLAPELPESLLAAPRGHYENASQLARAADVSVMSAFRFVQQLSRDGYLHESRDRLHLVRRKDLFRRWREASARRIVEVPACFLLRGDPQKELPRMLRSGRGCLALFAAASALGLGFVKGVAPHVYVPRLDARSLAAWKNIRAADSRESPDIMLRQAQAPQSIFRGAVYAKDVPVSDILQVWLDVSSSPSRGDEQADLIRRRLLGNVIDGEHAEG